MARKLRGFTLIEVLLVVALVGVLALIALPSYQGYRNRVLSRQAAQEIAVIGGIARVYWSDSGSYPNSLADIGMAGKNDPWGRAYVYYNIAALGRGGARKDHALNPLNTDFDLYSLGPDGQSKPQITQKASVDDVIRANNGAFVGIAADF
ncbi:MAG: prepilin-type N-terminal cleavage/methylation domain-containing protein [Burkholderiales bacterium]|nr:prepilin-type N-terminal cleavage/methylation domain-containing protein [Burkholderiales bacterium]MDE2628515.1 prepilin-type N-terminal cleavage/methylation domain-containing protein [Burkholderiales bacterium]